MCLCNSINQSSCDVLWIIWNETSLWACPSVSLVGWIVSWLDRPTNCRHNFLQVREVPLPIMHVCPFCVDWWSNFSRVLLMLTWRTKKNNIICKPICKVKYLYGYTLKGRSHSFHCFGFDCGKQFFPFKSLIKFNYISD